MSLTKTLRSTRGFTLIELMVVIVIIGILATSAMSVFQGAQVKARDAVRLSDLEALKSALEQYYAQNDEYPQGVTTATFKDKLKPYLSAWPEDPKHTGGFKYVYCHGARVGVAGQEYALAVRFENPDGVKDGAMGTATNELNTYVTGSNTALVTTAAAAATPATGTGCGVIAS